MYDPRQWAFVADINHNGSITISDVWLWFKQLYFYPGGGLLYCIIHKTPQITAFFEITFSSYGGIFSGVISFLCWLILLVGLAFANE
ncbi:MAG TPA: hypothetical protein VK991_12600 [Halomonas sp.]|nr:hypothetical protein [Halomonas sp.]